LVSLIEWIVSLIFLCSLDLCLKDLF